MKRYETNVETVHPQALTCTKVKLGSEGLSKTSFVGEPGAWFLERNRRKSFVAGFAHACIAQLGHWRGEEASVVSLIKNFAPFGSQLSPPRPPRRASSFSPPSLDEHHELHAA